MFSQLRGGYRKISPPNTLYVSIGWAIGRTLGLRLRPNWCKSVSAKPKSRYMRRRIHHTGSARQPIDAILGRFRAIGRGSWIAPAIQPPSHIHHEIQHEFDEAGGEIQHPSQHTTEKWHLSIGHNRSPLFHFSIVGPKCFAESPIFWG